MTGEEPSEDGLPRAKPPAIPSALSVLSSTLASMTIIMAVLVIVRWMLPPLLESSRYSWYRGQLRAERDSAAEQLQNVSLDGLSRISQLVSRRVTPSVVHIGVDQSFDLPALLGQDDELDSSKETNEPKLSGQGSGILVDRAGYILTNFHVVEGAETIHIRFTDESTDEASIVGFDRARDLAVLQVKPIDLPAMEWGDSEEVAVGSPVWAVGSPFGLHGSVTFGILSSKHRVDLTESEYRHVHRLQPKYSDLLQSDVAVNPGNSGGPLVNARGELIGVNTAILGSTFQGVSFSIPSNLAKGLYEEIREKSKSATAWLGVALDNAPLAKDEAVDDEAPFVPGGGAVVVGFRFGRSPAREGGILRGDIITSCDDKPIRDRTDLIKLISRSSPGKTVRLKLRRRGVEQRLEVVLGARFVELDVGEDESAKRP